jgi:hypothetical protein
MREARDVSALSLACAARGLRGSANIGRGEARKRGNMKENSGIVTRMSIWSGLGRLSAGIIGGTLLLACHDWYVWDRVFDKTAPGGPNYPSSPATSPLPVPGWYSGDSASSVPLPNFAGRKDRTLWLHGDALLNDAAGNVVAVTTNSIMVSDLPTSAAKGDPPTDADRKWYARNTSAVAIDVTSDATGTALPFFYNPTDPSTNNRIYPGDGVVLGTTLFALFHEWHDPFGPAGFAVNSYVFSVNNVDQDVSSWPQPVMHTLLNADGTSPLIEPSRMFQWGNAVYHDAASGFAYIFGISTLFLPHPLYVARAKNISCTPAKNPCITQYQQWQFLKSNGSWSQLASPTLSSLKQIGNIAGASEFSVDKVSFNGRTRFVLVHGRPFAQDDMVVQISKSNDLTHWEPFDPNVSSQYHLVKSVADDTEGLDPAVELGPAPACTNGFGTPAGHVWANKAAYYLSPIGKLYTSYYASVIDFTKQPNDNRDYLSCHAYGGIFGATRFSNFLDLTKLRPWCTSACWN